MPNLATADNTDDHARHRRIVGNALSDRATREQEYILKHYTDLLIEKLRTQGTKEKSMAVDIARWYTYAAFDAIGDLQFGESFHALVCILRALVSSFWSLRVVRYALLLEAHRTLGMLTRHLAIGKL